MSNQPPIQSRSPIWATLLFSLCGLALSIVSFIHDMKMRYGLQKGPSFCSINAHINCDVVSQSEWSRFLGVPLSAWGAVFFLTLLLASIAALDRDRLSRSLWAQSTFFVSAIASLIAIGLFAVSELVIGAICLICVGMYICIFLVCLSSLRALRGQSLFSAWIGGLFAIIKLPTALLGLNPNVKGKQRVALALCSIVVVLLFVLLSLVPWNLAKSHAGDSSDFVQLQIKTAVDRWRATSPSTLNVKEGDPLERDYRKGAEKPSITIVEFFDYECPACRSMSKALDQIISANPDKVALVHKNYPLDRACNPAIDHEMHKNACFAAQFARCAGEQGAYWKAAEFLFNLPELEHSEDPDSAQKTKTAIERGAATLGLDQEAVKACLASGRAIPKITADIKTGDAAKIDSTPTIFLNGKMVQNPHPMFLQAIIDEVSKADVNSDTSATPVSNP